MYCLIFVLLKIKLGGLGEDYNRKQMKKKEWWSRLSIRPTIQWQNLKSKWNCAKGLNAN